MIFKFTPKDRPDGLLADVEIHFEPHEPLWGLKLVGFEVWQRRSGNGRNVTFPARMYSVNGERRSFSLLRPIADGAASDALRVRILLEYEAWKARED